ADRNRSHWSTSKTPSYTKSVSWQHHRLCEANEPEKADKKTVESQKSVEDEDIIRLVAER
ncbi:YebO family protein, partial [Escherichia coli]|uniref:YebO family protein n=1 Tax=Escherichia coli TaxID=562 RepID=UPI002DB804B8